MCVLRNLFRNCYNEILDLWLIFGLSLNSNFKWRHCFWSSITFAEHKFLIILRCSHCYRWKWGSNVLMNKNPTFEVKLSIKCTRLNPLGLQEYFYPTTTRTMIYGYRASMWYLLMGAWKRRLPGTLFHKMYTMQSTKIIFLDSFVKSLWGFC